MRTILAELLFTATHYISTDDIYVDDVLYERALLEDPEISDEMSDVYWGIMPSQELKIIVPTAWLMPIYSAEEVRGKKVRLYQYDSEESPSKTFLLYCTITDVVFTIEGTEITILARDRAPFQTLLPRYVLTNDTFPTVSQSNRPPDHLGLPMPVVFGYGRKAGLLYVRADHLSNYYDYIVCHTRTITIGGLDAVYRNGVLVDPSEYTFYQNDTYDDGLDTYAWIRVTREQRDFSGALYQLSADVIGLIYGGAPIRNPAYVTANLLGSLVIGLGLPIDPDSFDAAAALLPDLYLDFGMISQRQALDIFNDLLYICHAVMDQNEDGEYYIEVDTDHSAAVAAHFGFKDGYWDNIIDVLNYGKTPVSEAVKKLTLRYRYNEWTQEYQQKSERTISTYGEDKTIESRYILDHETADRVTCFHQKYMQIGDVRIAVKVGLEGKGLKRGAAIKISIPSLCITDALFQVRSIRKEGETYDLKCISYSSEIYAYTAQTLPGSENNPSQPVSTLGLTLPAAVAAGAPANSAKKGTLQADSGGVLYINTDGSTAWAKVGSQ